MEGDDNLLKKAQTAAFRRLAYLESYPIHSFENLQEWRLLRRWVLDNNLLKDYQNQEYFRISQEVTKKQYRPKNPNSVLKRMWDYISGLM